MSRVKFDHIEIDQLPKLTTESGGESFTTAEKKST